MSRQSTPRARSIMVRLAQIMGRKMLYLETPPKLIETCVFSVMPEQFRRKGVRSEWADANRPGNPADCFIEGPSFDAAGNLFVVDIPFGRIFKITPDGTWSLAIEYEGWPNGLKKVRISPSCRSYCVRLDVRLAPVQQNRQALQETQRLCPFPIRVARHGYGAVRPECKMERQISGPTNAVYASAWVPTLTSIKQINRFRSRRSKATCM